MTESAGATDPPEAPDIKPGTLAWRIVIATTAYRFSLYLQKSGLSSQP